MSMNPIPRTTSTEDQDLIAEYLRKGGAVTVGETGVGTVDFTVASSWNQRRAKQKPQEENK